MHNDNRQDLATAPCCILRLIGLDVDPGQTTASFRCVYSSESILFWRNRNFEHILQLYRRKDQAFYSFFTVEGYLPRCVFHSYRLNHRRSCQLKFSLRAYHSQRTPRILRRNSSRTDPYSAAATINKTLGQDKL